MMKSGSIRYILSTWLFAFGLTISAAANTTDCLVQDQEVDVAIALEQYLNGSSIDIPTTFSKNHNTSDDLSTVRTYEEEDDETESNSIRRFPSGQSDFRCIFLDFTCDVCFIKRFLPGIKYSAEDDHPLYILNQVYRL